MQAAQEPASTQTHSDVEAMELDALPTPKADITTTATTATTETVTTSNPAQLSTPVVIETDAVPLSVSSGIEGVTCPPTLVFGNSTLYVFFRLYQIAYERLAKGRELAAQQAAHEIQTNRPHSDVSRPADMTPPPSAFGVPPSNSASQNTRTQLTAEQRYDKYLGMVRQMIDNEIDANKLEDDTRELLGYLAYPLFTLHNVIFQLMKQLTQLASDEMCEAMLNLYSYERSRTSMFSERVYLSNAVAVLGEELFRIHMDTEKGMINIKYLTELPPHTKPPKGLEERWTQYVLNFVHSDAPDNAAKHPVFRKSQLRHQREKLHNDGLIINNALECKIDMKTCKLFYISKTEDYQYRKGMDFGENLLLNI